jgi:adenylyltransferase/sulfurtransferase
MLLDVLRGQFRELELRRDPACPVCGENPAVRELIDYEAFCGVAAGARPVGAEITIDELEQRLGDAGPEIVVLDVREPWEWEIAHIPGSRHFPLGQLPKRLGELDGQAEIVTLCHRGQRSLTAQRLLQGAGFRARSLAGGIDAWAERVDPEMARY